MTRLAIGIVLGILGLVGMGLGGALDAKPVDYADCRSCPMEQSAAPAWKAPEAATPSTRSMRSAGS